MIVYKVIIEKDKQITRPLSPPLYRAHINQSSKQLVIVHRYFKLTTFSYGCTHFHL